MPSTRNPHSARVRIYNAVDLACWSNWRSRFSRLWARPVEPTRRHTVVFSEALEQRRLLAGDPLDPAINLAQVAGDLQQTLNSAAVSYTHLRAHETGRNLVCRLLL